MGIKINSMARTTCYRGIVAVGKKQVEQLVDAHLQSCGNQLLCPALESTSSFMSRRITSSPSRGLCVDVKALWPLLQGKNLVNFYTHHSERGQIMLSATILDRSSKTVLVSLLHRKCLEEIEGTLADSMGFTRALACMKLQLFFSPNVIPPDKQILNLADLFSPFSDLQGFLLTPPAMVARNYLGWLNEAYEFLPPIAAHSSRSVAISLVLPELRRARDAEARGASLIFNRHAHEPRQLLANLDLMKKDDKLARLLTAMEQKTDFSAELIANSSLRENEQQVIWEKEDIGIVFSSMDFLERAYREILFQNNE